MELLTIVIRYLFFQGALNLIPKWLDEVIDIWINMASKAAYRDV